MLKKSSFSPTQPRRAGALLAPGFVLVSLRGSTYSWGLDPALPDFGELSRAVPVPLFKQGQPLVGRDFGELSRAATVPCSSLRP